MGSGGEQGGGKGQGAGDQALGAWDDLRGARLGHLQGGRHRTGAQKTFVRC